MCEYDKDDLESLALCGWKEARGEGPDGMRAVMHVIVNRAVAWHGGQAESIHRVVYGKNQFSSMTVPSDPEYYLRPESTNVQYQFCRAMAEAVCEGSDPDATGGALYYACVENIESDWFKRNIIDDPARHPVKARIGRQTFFA